TRMIRRNIQTSGWFSTESRARLRVSAIISSVIWCCAMLPLLSPTSPTCGGYPPLRAGTAAGLHADGLAVVQQRRSGHDHSLARLEALSHLDPVAVHPSQLHRPEPHRSVPALSRLPRRALRRAEWIERSSFCREWLLGH